jgi:hypothetical protein
MIYECRFSASMMFEDIWAEVDMSNQIDNSWNKDSCIALKSGKSGFVVRIKSEDKKLLRKKFIFVDSVGKKKINRRVIVMIYCFMLYKVLKISGCARAKLCNDAGPRWAVLKYLDFVLKHYGEPPIGKFARIKFRMPGDQGSLAHPLARKAMKGRRKEDYLINKSDIAQLGKIIKKAER